MADVALPGETRVVDDVPEVFAELVAATAPRSIGLSGGEMAKRCYEGLRDVPLDWSNIDIFLGDERFVPIDSPDSNEGMARRALLDRVQPKTIHGMARGDSPQEAADRYDALVRESPPIELLHLGLGPDGHTASLFPGSPALDEKRRFVVATGDDLHPHPRITLTFPGIARSPLVIVTVAGNDKREAIERIRAGEDLPGARIRADRVIWLGDAAALGEPEPELA
jgi:6-phosphogluconolactonase